MVRIKVEDVIVKDKFGVLAALRNGLEEAIIIYGARKIEAWKLLRATYPHVDFTTAEYKDETNELIIPGKDDEEDEEDN